MLRILSPESEWIPNTGYEIDPDGLVRIYRDSELIASVRPQGAQVVIDGDEDEA